MHTELPRLTPYGHRLDLAEGGTGSLTAEKGFSAYQRVDVNGSIGLFVPELNFLEAVMQNLVTGVRIIYRNITLGEQPRSLFEPPSGATITYSDKPDGIIVTRR